MQDVFATTFVLASEDDVEPLDEAILRTGDWLKRRIHADLELLSLGAHERSFGQTTVAWAHRRDESHDREAFDVVLEHPAEEDRHGRWRAAVVLTREAGRSRATVRVSRGSTVHELRPRAYVVAPPGIVIDLLRSPLHGYAGGLEVSPSAARVRADQVQAFVDDQLRQSERVLPIVACDSGASRPLSPDVLARRLVGLAHVVVLHSVEAWEALRYELPQAYVPYGGARLYWPRFGDPDDRIRHPYFTRRELRTRDLDRRLSALLRDLAVSRVPRDRLPDRLRRDELRRRTVPLADPADDREERIKQLEADLAELPQWLDALDETEARAGELEDENARLAQDLAVARSNLQSAWQHREAERADDDMSPLAAPDAFGEQFLDAMDELAGPALAFTDRARGCGRSNSYRRPAEMYAALVQLEELARLYHDGDGSVGGDITDVAKAQNGLRLALHDNGYRNSTFDFEGQQLDRLPHVKLDDHVAPTEVGRIYFALDSENARLVIDWFGVKQDRPT